MDGYCNFGKIHDNYRSKVDDRVTRNYNGHILHRYIDHGLTQDEERQFTSKPCHFDYPEKNIPETHEGTEQHSNNGYLSFQSCDSIDSDDTLTKTISTDKRANNADNEAVVDTGNVAEHVMKKHQTISMPSKMLT